MQTAIHFVFSLLAAYQVQGLFGVLAHVASALFAKVAVRKA